MAAKVDQSRGFTQPLELLPSALPGHDEVLFLPDIDTALISAMEGQTARYDPSIGSRFFWTHP